MANLLCAYTLVLPQQKAFTQLLQKQFAQKNPWGALDWFDLYKSQFFNLLFTHKHLYYGGFSFLVSLSQEISLILPAICISRNSPE